MNQIPATDDNATSVARGVDSSPATLEEIANMGASYHNCLGGVLCPGHHRLFAGLLVTLAAVTFHPLALGQITSGDSAPVRRPSPSLYSHRDWPKAKPADVASIGSIINSFYESISADAVHTLDRARLRSLFVPDGRIAAAIAPRKHLPADVIFRTPDQYADDSDAYTTTHGFFDSTPANQIESFGLMAHVYSMYESRQHPSDPRPMARGIKSFELLKSGDRWWIVEVYWDEERSENPLAARFLRDCEH